MKKQNKKPEDRRSQPTKKNNRDMFNWSLYHLHYQGELKGNAKNYLPFLSVGDYEKSC